MASKNRVPIGANGKMEEIRSKLRSLRESLQQKASFHSQLISENIQLMARQSRSELEEQELQDRILYHGGLMREEERKFNKLNEEYKALQGKYREREQEQEFLNLGI